MVCLDKAYWKCQEIAFSLAFLLNISKNCSDGFDHEVPCNNPSLLYIVNPRVYTVLYTCIYVCIYIYGIQIYCDCDVYAACTSVAPRLSCYIVTHYVFLLSKRDSLDLCLYKSIYNP